MSNRKREVLASLEREVRTMIAGVILFNERTARALALNGTDLQCLNLIDLRGTATPGELARCCCLTTGGITVVLDRLENAGYIDRRASPRDRRSTLVALNPRKAARLKAVYRPQGEALATLLAKYSLNELEAIGSFLHGLNEPETPSGDRPQNSRGKAK